MEVEYCTTLRWGALKRERERYIIVLLTALPGIITFEERLFSEDKIPKE